MSLPLGFTSAAATALPLHVLDREQFAGWCGQQPAATVAWARAQGFTA
ncbi:leucyl aminopeptidase family protein, partial [Xanthomonas sp. Kuri4-1]